jgi:hypothetical protein
MACVYLVGAGSLGRGAESGVITCTAERLHEKVRSRPYPRSEHVVHLNPPPLIVPGRRERGCLYRFQLSKDPGFGEADTITSEPKPWAMFNPHRVLSSGVWHWRFRAGVPGAEAAWSEPLHFTITDQTARFATPKVDVFLAGIPKGSPRTHPFLVEWAKAKSIAEIKKSREFSPMLGRASGALERTAQVAARKPGGKVSIERIAGDIEFLAKAYLLTGDKTYQDALLTLGTHLLPVERKVVNGSGNFGRAAWADGIALVLDCCRDRMAPDVRETYVAKLAEATQAEYPHHVGRQESTIFDNHFWQHCYRKFQRASLVLLYERPESKEMVEYYYELWTARAPASGFNLEGNWVNGTGYFGTNIHTLYDVPSLLSSYTGFNFFAHPWFRNAGRGMLYSAPPDSLSDGFGDGHSKRQRPFRTRAALADFLAREHNVPYAGWYARECDRTGSALASDYLLREYRILNDQPYAAELPPDAPDAVLFKDTGVAEMHSSIRDYGENLFVSFRSSPFGSGSHTLANQNSFNIQYRGQAIFRAKGHYFNFSDPHNLMSYRHTRASNSILVDGIGQPFSADGYGWIARFSESDSIAYSLGDASHAYRGTSTDPMWIKNFARAGVEQSVANGFGKTPLSLFRRHVVLLRPNIVVIYDELAARSPVRFDWLLHSPLPMRQTGSGVQVEDEESRAAAELNLYSGQAITPAVSTGYRVPPDVSVARRKPKEPLPQSWTLTASTERCENAYILAVIAVGGKDGLPGMDSVSTTGTVSVGPWRIQAELDATKPAHLLITRADSQVALAYAVPEITVGKRTRRATHTQSTLVLDQSQGNDYSQEIVDSLPRTSY